MEVDVDTRVARAANYFREGYNCSQAVFMAYAELYGIERNTATSLATSFGGGCGRLREMCGAVSGMFMVLGLHYPFGNPKDKAAKDLNYEAVQRTAKEFKAVLGSYICADLPKLRRGPQNPESAERTTAYYNSRPCVQCVELAAAITGREISGRFTV